MILCIGATPAAQRVMVFRSLTVDGVNRASKTVDGIAGKAINVAKVLKMLGAQPAAVGFLGGQQGETIREVLRERGIEQEFIWVPEQTRQCITVIDESADTQTELVEESQPVALERYEALLGVVQRRAPNCRAVIMSGTLTPGAPVDFYFRCLEQANATGILSVLDAKEAALDAALPARPGLVKPNRAELAATVGRELDDERDIVAAMKVVHERGAQRVVITSGAKPTLAFDGGNIWRISAPSISVVNPIGSGDAFTAGAALGLLRGDDLGEACRLGSACGAANALTLMAGEIDPKEVERIAARVKVERTKEPHR